MYPNYTCTKVGFERNSLLSPLCMHLKNSVIQLHPSALTFGSVQRSRLYLKASQLSHLLNRWKTPVLIVTQISFTTQNVDIDQGNHQGHPWPPRTPVATFIAIDVIRNINGVLPIFILVGPAPGLPQINHHKYKLPLKYNASIVYITIYTSPCLSATLK